MKRIIPKPSKVRTAFYKDLTIRDVVYLCVCGLICLVTLTANVTGALWIALSLAFSFTLLFFFKVEDRLYYELFIFFRYLISKKKFHGDLQCAIEKIDNDIIRFKGGYCAGVLKIEPLEFFLLREEMQDKLIDTFSVVYKNLAVGQKLSLVKLDRPVFLDEYVTDIKRKIAELNKERIEAELLKDVNAKLEILQSRLKELQMLNTNDGCCYYNAFYLVLYGDGTSLDMTLRANVRELGNGGITATRITGAELIGFAKRTVTQVFDERETEKVQDARKYIV